MLIHALLLYFAIPRMLLPSYAFSWPRLYAFSADEREMPQAFGTVSSITDAEIASLLANKDTLSSYDAKPDCFRKAAGRLRLRCSETDMTEDQRIESAIAMTLCELATARHHSPPMECAEFSPEAPPASSVKHRGYGNCVEALSRSAQFWASYSGYLRETPQLCFAFRRWNDIDTAKDIYRNATLEKIALIQFVVSREKVYAEQAKASENQLSEMRDALAALRASSADIEVVVASAKTTFTDLTEHMTDVQRQGHEDRIRSMSEADALLDDVVRQHLQSLLAVIPSVERGLSDGLTAVLRGFQLVNQDTDRVASDVQHKLIELGFMISDFTQSITQLSNTASQTAVILQSSSQHAQILQQAQLNAIDSAGSLTSTIDLLINTTIVSVESINDTVVHIKQHLIGDFTGSQGWWRDRVLWALQFVLGLDHSFFAYLDSFPVFRIGLGLLSMLSFIVQSMFSAVVTAIVVLLSYKKSFSRSSVTVADTRSASSSPPPSYQNPDHASSYTSGSTKTDIGLRAVRRRQSVISLATMHGSGLRPDLRYRVSRIPERLWNPVPES